MPLRPRLLLLLPLAAAPIVACDKDATPQETPFAATTAPTATMAPPPPEPPKAPEIIVDSTKISVGSDRVQAGEPGLADKVGVFLGGRPAIAGQAVDVVVMRNAKPSEVIAVVSALRRAGARGATAKTETRDGNTQALPLSFATTVPDCAAVAWIAKDAAIDVWPAGGGRAKRVIKGMAGPDMTLGTEAVRKEWSGCTASELVFGADEKMTWGLAFDLATQSLQLPGARASSAVFVGDASPGHKPEL
jgi:hypothetical protein